MSVTVTGWPRVELQDKIFPENFLKVLMAGNMEKAQPRSRQRPRDRLGKRKEQSPALVMCQGGKRQKGVTVLMWLEKPWSTRLPVRNCFSQVCTPQKQNPLDPELQPVRNAHSALAHTDLESSGQPWRAADNSGDKTGKGGRALWLCWPMLGLWEQPQVWPCQARTSLRDCGRAQVLLDLNLLKKMYNF